MSRSDSFVHVSIGTLFLKVTYDVVWSFITASQYRKCQITKRHAKRRSRPRPGLSYWQSLRGTPGVILVNRNQDTEYLMCLFRTWRTVFATWRKTASLLSWMRLEED